MSQSVYSFFYIAIDTEAGVTAEQFETFVREKGVHLPCYPGWRWTLFRGLRGERVDQYLMLFEMKDAAQRARFMQDDGELTAEAEHFWHLHPDADALLSEWCQLATFARRPTIFTHFDLLAENPHSTLPGGPRFDARSGTARILGTHYLALRPGVQPQEFEQFIAQNAARIVDYPGWKFHLLKGHSGNRLDGYVVMMEIESEAALNVFYPQPDIATASAADFACAHRDTKQMYEEWKQLASFSGSPQLYTDYLAVAECGTLK